MTPATFEAEVAAKLGAWFMLSTRVSLENLANLLGCPFIGARASSPFEVVSPQNEAVVKNAWVTMLGNHDATKNLSWTAEMYIICGLLQADRWRTAFDNDTTARAFLTIVARYFWNNTPNAGITKTAEHDVHYIVWMQLQSVLTDWLPSRPPGEIFTLRTLASVMFGDAWCVMVYDVRDRSDTFASLIADTRPQFLPGRIAAGPSQFAAPLPDLG